MDKTYNPAEIEGRIYDKWERGGYFHAEVDRSRKPFTIVIPPPNITGQLHMGHALDETMQDIIIRTKRMQGYNALWQPGTDHASIATEVKVTEALQAEGIDKKTLGRDGFMKRAWAWREEYGHRITNQIKRLGCSCDWQRERFTMDEGCNKAVVEAFCSMYEKGYIYRGERIINWCPKCGTSLSDAEVAYVEQQAHLWHIKYPLIDETTGKPSETEFLEFATTRPETMLGDTAVAVHPDDERYKAVVGRKVWLPIVNKAIPVIADEYVDMAFGTGVVKITPGHDPNDFEVGKRHNLPIVNILNDDATINENGGAYQGLDSKECRKRIVSELDSMGLLVRIEDYSHNVGTHDRCGTTIEPMVKSQWFVRMQKLIQPAVEAVKSGEIRLVPARMDKIFYNWTDNIRDWCVSRQLWWGHRIPAYYCPECGEITVSRSAVGVCPKCGHEGLNQDEDSLDTWFSSALWPFSTLGWPDHTEDLDYFYPTDVLVSGYDIIFFWVIRMIFSGYEHMGKKPFSTVLFHGLIRDSQGRKMSKSLGNGIDPLEVIDRFGADALRLSIIIGNDPSSDSRYTEEKVEAARNFANKVWNAARFIIMNLDKKKALEPDRESLTTADRYILGGMNKLVGEVTANLDEFQMGVAAQKIVDFLWDEYCDWYIEMAKVSLYGKDEEAAAHTLWVLKTVLITALKLLHPFMPFITEEIFCNLQDEEETIMTSAWPKPDCGYDDAEAARDIEHVKDAVKAVRNIRSEQDIHPGKRLAVYIDTADERAMRAFRDNMDVLVSLAGASQVHLCSGEEAPDSAIVRPIIDATVWVLVEDAVDIGAQIEKLRAELARLDGEVARCEGMLSNERFVSKAPAAKVEAERQKLAKYLAMRQDTQTRLDNLS